MDLINTIIKLFNIFNNVIFHSNENQLCLGKIIADASLPLQINNASGIGFVLGPADVCCAKAQQTSAVSMDAMILG
ncbi:hypothetical protein [Lysinibacillus sp. CTST325]